MQAWHEKKRNSRLMKINKVGEETLDTLCFAEKDAKEAAAVELAAAEGVEDLLPDSKAFIDWFLEEHAVPIVGEPNSANKNQSGADRNRMASRWIEMKIEKNI